MIESKKVAVSVLMPVYNSMPYLSKSLTSLIEQTFSDIEIICINDGSTDNSLKTIKRYAQKDSRIRIINKSNSGYGDSMNIGLKSAMGEYIAILEPDDWYEKDMIHSLYNLAIKNNVDVIKCDFFQYYEKNNINKQYGLFHNICSRCGKILNNNQIMPIYSMQPSIWSALYRRDFLEQNHICFLSTPGASFQDTSFNFKVFALANKIMLINKPYVHYRVDNISSSINNRYKKALYIKSEYDEINRFISQNNLSQQLHTEANLCQFLTYKWILEGTPLFYISNIIHNFLSSVDINLLPLNKRQDASFAVGHPILYGIKFALKRSLHRIKSCL